MIKSTKQKETENRKLKKKQKHMNHFFESTFIPCRVKKQHSHKLNKCFYRVHGLEWIILRLFKLLTGLTE